MGIETIKDSLLRKNWKDFIQLAHQNMSDQDITLEFTEFKNNGSYAKAKAGLPGVFFGFSEDSDRTWVELELKPRTVGGSKVPQDELYAFLKQRSIREPVPTPYKITWNEEDLRTSPRKESGKSKRIKIYLLNPKREEWINAMAVLAQRFIPLLNEYKAK
jgi:hypothetical protein